MFLYFTALEEAVKAYYYAAFSVNLAQYKDEKKRIMDHRGKIEFFLINIAIQQIIENELRPPEIETRNDLRKALLDYKKAILDTKDIREQCIYVDYIDNEWSTPLDATQENASEFKTLTTDFITYIKESAESLFQIPKEAYHEIPQFTRAVLLSIFIEYIDDLYHKNIITKTEHLEAKQQIVDEYNQ
jgi:AbiV family abortive infection protein